MSANFSTSSLLDDRGGVSLSAMREFLTIKAIH